MPLVRSAVRHSRGESSRDRYIPVSKSSDIVGRIGAIQQGRGHAGTQFNGELVKRQ